MSAADHERYADLLDTLEGQPSNLQRHYDDCQICKKANSDGVDLCHYGEKLAAAHDPRQTYPAWNHLSADEVKSPFALRAHSAGPLRPDRDSLPDTTRVDVVSYLDDDPRRLMPQDEGRLEDELSDSTLSRTSRPTPPG